MKTGLKRIHKKIVAILFGDLAILYGALFLALDIRYFSRNQGIIFHKHLIPFTIVFALWMIVFGAFGLYDLKLMKNGKIFLYRLLQAMASNTVLAIIVFYMFPFEIEPRRNLFLITAAATSGIFLWRSFFNLAIIRAPAMRAAFVGLNQETIDLACFLLLHPQLGYKPAAFFSGDKPRPTLFPPALPPSIPKFSLAENNFASRIRETKTETIIISPDMKEDRALVKNLIAVIPMGISVVEFPAFHEMITGKIPLSLIEEIWFLENLIGIKKRSYEFMKRTLDIILAAIVGIPALLLFPFIALGIMLGSKGPIFFRQKRVGKNGRIFEMIKFRSTYRTSVPAYEGRRKEEAGIYTPIGAFLRKSYMDELPQLINVLRGEMSFIGPRPERPEFVEEFKQRISFYEMRLLALPGLTGWAQINMKDDASVEDAPEKMQYDLYYIKNRSFILDLLIMLRTVFTLLKREGR